MNFDIANIISSLGVIIAAWFSYNQYTRNKLTDLKVDQYKKDEEKKSYRRSENSAKVFGELWRILFEVKADRVYIVQPHPIGMSSHLSIQFFETKSLIEHEAHMELDMYTNTLMGPRDLNNGPYACKISNCTLSYLFGG